MREHRSVARRREATGADTPRRAIGRSVALAPVVAMLAACGGGWQLADRSDSAVQAEEARVAALAGAPGAVFGERSTCEARLLGRIDGASFAWVVCEAAIGSSSGPIRVDGDRVRAPGDGSRYADDIEQLFPAGLAELILSSEPQDLAP